MHPFDAKGKRRDYDAIPKSVADMVDDPFRSLAGELRRLGGYSKETTPFSEFLWADFLRRRMKPKQLAHRLRESAEGRLQTGQEPMTPVTCPAGAGHRRMIEMPRRTIAADTKT